MQSLNSKSLASRTGCALENLPVELQEEIITKIASSSLRDLFHVKSSCKLLYQLGSVDSVYEHVSLPEFSEFHPFDDVAQQLFFMKCVDKGNPEALFRFGFKNYFSKGNAEAKCDGLKCIAMAAEKGNVNALYVYGILLLCCGDNKGFDYLSEIYKSETLNYDLSCLRKVIVRMVRRIWDPFSIVAGFSFYNEKKNCRCRIERKLNAWETDGFKVSENYDVICGFCRWINESLLFIEMLKFGDFSFT